MEKLNTKEESSNKKLKNNSASSPPPKAEKTSEEKSPKEILFESLNKYLPTGYSGQYDDLSITEQNIIGLEEQIRLINELLKPVSHANRKRGTKSTLTAAERKLLKSARQKLKTQLIIERENWDRQYKLYRESTVDEIQKTKNEQLVEQARSGYYVRKYKETIVNRIKSFFDNVLQKDSNSLTAFKRSIVNSKDEKAYSLILDFITKHQETPFITAFFISHKDLHKRYVKFIKELLKEWNGKNSRKYSFRDSELTVTKEI